MIVSTPFDGWGNRLIQYCFARALGIELDYYVKCSKISYLPNSGDFNTSGARFDDPVIDIGHKSKWRHRVDFDDIKAYTDCRINVHSYLEYYPNIEKHRDAIRDEWVHIDNPYRCDYFPRLNGKEKGFRKFINGKFERYPVKEITPNDIVLSIRLGRDYLGQHRFRLLIGDYFKIILDNVDYDRVFITSQDPHNPVLEDLYPYDPIFLDHISPMDTFSFVRLFNKIALSQSTYSWWAGYLSEADEIYFPITQDGPWSYGKDQRPKWKDYGHDLMVNEPRYTYVSYKDRLILGDYTKTLETIM